MIKHNLASAERAMLSGEVRGSRMRGCSVRRPNQMKRCAQCGLEKLASEFAGSQTNRDGLRGDCSVCMNLRRKAARLAKRNASAATKFANRFWSKVNRSSSDGCWPWIGSTSAYGYGEFQTGSRRSKTRKVYRAHRVAWELIHGNIPLGLHVLHRCDNPPCVRPDHLFLGTAADNVADRIAKGRTNQPTGEAIGMAKLTVREVVQIRLQRLHGKSVIALAKEYGVSRSSIYSIVNYKMWKEVA